MYTGAIVYWNDVQNFGFIKPDTEHSLPTGRIFIHHSSRKVWTTIRFMRTEWEPSLIFQQPRAGMRVRFSSLIYWDGKRYPEALDWALFVNKTAPVPIGWDTRE